MHTKMTESDQSRQDRTDLPQPVGPAVHDRRCECRLGRGHNRSPNLGGETACGDSHRPVLETAHRLGRRRPLQSRPGPRRIENGDGYPRRRHHRSGLPLRQGRPKYTSTVFRGAVQQMGDNPVDVDCHESGPVSTTPSPSPGSPRSIPSSSTGPPSPPKNKRNESSTPGSTATTGPQTQPLPIPSHP